MVVARDVRFGRALHPAEVHSCGYRLPGVIRSVPVCIDIACNDSVDKSTDFHHTRIVDRDANERIRGRHDVEMSHFLTRIRTDIADSNFGFTGTTHGTLRARRGGIAAVTPVVVVLYSLGNGGASESKEQEKATGK